MESAFLFPDGLISALWLLLAVCILLPALYYVWMIYKKSFDHIAMLAGIASFFMFGYLVSGILLGNFAPQKLADAYGSTLYASMRALCVTVSEVGGFWLALFILKRERPGVNTAIGFGLGYRLFDLLYLGAFNALFRLANALSVNQDGLQSVLANVDESAAPALEEQLRILAQTSPKIYIMSSVDYLCMFVISVCLARLIWYGMEGGKLAADKRLIALSAGFRLVSEWILAKYQSLGEKYSVYAGIYYVLVAALICFTYWQSKRRDDPEMIRAAHLKAKLRKKR